MKRRLFGVFVLVFIVFLMCSCHEPVNVEDTGETVSGTYVWSINIGVTMESAWIFEGNSVTNRYYNGLDYVEESYTYVIGIKNDVKVIKLYTTGNIPLAEYEFDYGDGYVMIAGERYETPED